MGLLGKGVLVNWGGIVKSKEQDYNSWHSLEHMPERIMDSKKKHCGDTVTWNKLVTRVGAETLRVLNFLAAKTGP